MNGANWKEIAKAVPSRLRALGGRGRLHGGGSGFTGVVARLPLLTNGEALVALALVVSGAVIARDGARQLWAAWKALQPYLPFTLPADTPGVILNSLPLIVTLFVCTVSSICAVLIGLLWVFGGLADAFRARKWTAEASEFQHPELVAEALAQAVPRPWAVTPRVARVIGFVWPAARSMSPVSYHTCKSIVAALWKVALTAAAIAIVTLALQSVPALVRRFLHQNMILVVPSVAPLYHLLILVAVVDVVAALSLVPLRKRTFERSSRSMIVRGQGDPHVLFALIEEGARLLTPKGQHGTRGAVRLVSDVSDRVKGTLVESAATPLRFLGRPAGYVCVPLAAVMLIGGFSRIIHFSRSVSPMPYADFLQFHLVSYALTVAFAFGMIVAGLHFAQLARKVFAIRRYRSSLVFCAVRQADTALQEQSAQARTHTRGNPPMWKLNPGVDDQFAAWARQPSGTRRFRVDAYWAETVSETADQTAARHLIGVRSGHWLDEAMARILDLPFRVKFEVEAVEEQPEALAQEEEGGRKRETVTDGG